MKKFMSLLYFIISSFLLIPYLAFSATISVPVSETLKDNGITLEVFDINKTELPLSAGKKTILGASSDFIVYKVKDDLRGDQTLVWDLLNGEVKALSTYIDIDNIGLYTHHVDVVNNTLFIKAIFDGECALWQLTKENTKQLLTVTNCSGQTSEINNKLYITSVSCEDNDPLLSSFDLITGKTEEILKVSDFNAIIGNANSVDCTRIRSVVGDDKKLYLTTQNGYYYQWHTWEYDLENKQLNQNYLVKYSTEGYIDLFLSEQLYIVTQHYFPASATLEVYNLNSRELSARVSISGDNYFVGEYVGEPYGMVHGEFINIDYSEGGTYISDVTFFLKQYNVDNAKLEQIVSVNAENIELGSFDFHQDKLYYTPSGDISTDPFAALPTEQKPIKLTGEPSAISSKYHPVNQQLYYVGDDNDIWQYDTELKVDTKLNAPDSLLTATYGSDPESIQAVLGSLFFLANDNEEYGKSLWTLDPESNHVEKLVNPSTGLAFNLSTYEVINEQLVFKTNDNEWFSYSVQNKTITKHTKLDGLYSTVKNYDDTDTLHFIKEDVFWLYNLAEQTLTQKYAANEIPVAQDSEINGVSYVHFDNRYFAYVEGTYNLSTWPGKDYIELWELVESSLVKRLARVDADILGQDYFFTKCRDFTRCTIRYNNALHLIESGWHLSLPVGSSEVEIDYFDFGQLAGADSHLYTFIYNDALYFSNEETGDSYSNFLYYLNEQTNLIEEIPFPEALGSAYVIKTAEQLLLLGANENEPTSTMWRMSDNNKEFTHLYQVPFNIYYDGIFNPVSSAMINHTFYSPLAYFNADDSFGAELVALSLYQHSPEISGVPHLEVTANAGYEFIPQANDEYDLPLSFSVANKPSWASFDENTGKLSGTPAATNVGNYADIVISVSNGVKTSDLSVFSLTVNAVAEPTRPVKNKSSSGVMSIWYLLGLLMISAIRKKRSLTCGYYN